MPAGRKLNRKNLMVDDARVKALACLRGTSESEAVRDAVDFGLAAEEIVTAIRDLHALAGLTTYSERCPTQDESVPRHQVPDTTEIIQLIRDPDDTQSL